MKKTIFRFGPLCLVFIILSLLAMLSGCSLLPEKAEEVKVAGKEEQEDTKASVSDWEHINKDKKLTIGITISRPMNYYKKDGETLTGFDTDLAREVCDRLGLEAEFQVINWDNMMIELDTENVDCIWNGMSITETRQEEMSISRPYLRNYPVLVIKKDRKDELLASPCNYRITSEAGSSTEGMIDGSVLQSMEAKVSAYDTFYGASYESAVDLFDAIEAVKEDRADIAFVDYGVAKGIIDANKDYKDLMISTDYDFGYFDCGIGFRKGSDALEHIEEMLKSCYDDGTIKKLAKKYGIKSMLIHIS